MKEAATSNSNSCTGSADETAEDGMAQPATVGALNEFQLTAALWLQPRAFAHLCGGQAMPGAVGLRQVHKRAFGSFQLLQFLIHLLP